MASWIIHLRIAEALLERFPALDAEKFALGNVAPDSGKPDERWENFTPPPRITHFQDPADPERDCMDLVFFRRHLEPLRGEAGGGSFSFRLGYFFHLLTDNLWARQIGRPTMEKYKAQFAADRDFIWEVKRDWYGLDFIYVRDHPGCLYWRVFLQAKPERGGLDFLVPESLAWSVRHIQQYYQTIDEHVNEMYNRPYIYLSQAQVDRFVAASCRCLERIYQYLWIDGASSEALPSALALPICKEDQTWQKIGENS